jgi:hypothetical protein
VQTWKKLAGEAAQRRDEDTSCFAVSRKLSNRGPVANVAVSNIVKAGQLEKRNKMRYVVIAKSGLTYYTRQQGEQRGHVPLADILSVSQSGLGNRERKTRFFVCLSNCTTSV